MMTRAFCRLTWVTLLRYQISQGPIRPDPDHLLPLEKFPIPKNKAILGHVINLFIPTIYNGYQIH